MFTFNYSAELHVSDKGLTYNTTQLIRNTIKRSKMDTELHMVSGVNA